MKQLRQILLSLLVATLLAGAIPYQSLYCTVMKRKIDDGMRVCCLHHHEKSGSSVNPSSGLQTIDKPALSAFELSHSVHFVAFPALPGIPLAIHAPASEPGGSTTQFDHTHPPPDLVIRFLDLRI